MFKRIVLIIGTVAFNLSAMDNQQPYGHNINKITVSTMKDSLTVPVDNTTTVLGVKTYLQDSEGIPTGNQNLHAVWKTWWPTPTGWAQDHSVSLVDDCKVKDVMALYKTTTFRLCLQLLKAQATQNQ